MLERYPFVIPLGALLAAMGLSSLGAGLLTASGALILAAALYLTFGRGSGIDNLIARRRLRVIWVFPLMLSISLGILEYHRFVAPRHDSSQPGHSLTGLIEEKVTMEQGERLLLLTDNYLNPGGMAAAPFRLMVYTGVTPFGAGDRIEIADDIEWLGEDSGFTSDYESFLLRRGVLGRVVCSAQLVKRASGADTFFPSPVEARKCVSGVIDRSEADALTRSMLKMLVCGDKSDCSSSLRSSFSLSGMAHIFALSGMHLWIVAGIVLWLLLPLNLICPSKTRFLIAIPVVWIYCYAVGLPWSTVRAAIMLSLFLLSRALERGNISLNALFASAFIILAVSPGAIADPGFQLSVFAVLCLTAYSDALYLIDRRRYPMLYRLTSFLLTVVVATAGTWAITACHFGLFAPGFALSNILVLPLLPLYMISGILYTAGLAAGTDIAFLKDFLELGAHLVSDLAGWLGGSSSLAIPVRPHPVTVCLWTGGVLLFGFYLSSRRGLRNDRERKPRKDQWRRVPAIACALVLGGVVSLPVAASDAKPVSRIMLRRSLFSVSMSLSENGEPLRHIDVRRGGTSEFNFHGMTVVYVDENGYGSRARRRLKAPDSPYPCDWLIIAEGYRGNLEDLLRFFRPATVIECRNRESMGMTVEEEAAIRHINALTLRADDRYMMEWSPE